MNLYSLEIPDDPAQLPSWLEAHLTGIDLAKLVAELSAVHDASPGETISIEQLLGDQLGPVLDGGLGRLPSDTLRQLLTHPRLLLDLQELVFIRGGPYWERSNSTEQAIDDIRTRGRRRLEASLPTGSARVGIEAAGNLTVDPAKQHVMILRPTVPWYRQAWVASLATAAVILFGVFVYEHRRPPVTPPVAAATAWGWSRPDALPDDAAPDAYLNALADAAGEWFKKRPEDRAELARRISEFRQGCSVLLLAEHRPLADEDREWLLERCRSWAAKLDTHLAAIESSDNVAAIRLQSDETVNKLIDALRNRAKSLAVG